MELQAERVKELSCGSCGAALEPGKYKPLSSVDCPQCGQKVQVPAGFGELVLTGVLGRGAAGLVCRALDTKLHRQVAVKLLSDSMSDKALVDACQREAQAMARLSHRNIVQVYQIGQYRGTHFIVMELLEGGSVEKLMLGQPVPVPEVDVLRLAIDVAEGLGAALRVNMIHLDVKPGNMLFDAGGTAKLIDFGTAAFAHHEGADIGTPYYVAPEIVRSQKPDFRSDMFSLGATLHHILAGKPPFDGSSVKAVIRARLKEPAPDLRTVRSDIHPQTAEIVARMLAIDPAERFASYDDLLDALYRARYEAEQGPALPQPASALAAPVKRKKSNALFFIASAVVILLMALTSYIVTTMLTRASPVTQAPTVPSSPVAAPKPLAVVQPVVSRPSVFATEAKWNALALADPLTSSGGAKLIKQPDGSVMVTGIFGEKQDVYTVVTRTDLRTIASVGIEALADKDLPHNGPGRDGGFVVTGVTVDAASAATPDQKQRLTLTHPEASYEERGGELAGVLDDNPATGWAVPTSQAGVDHTATFILDKPYTAAGPILLTFTIKHETQKSYLGKFKLWAAADSAAPATVAKPLVAVDPPKTTAPAVPAAPTPPPPPAPEVARFAAPAAPKFAMGDAHQWYTMDILSVTPSIAVKFKKLDDGSVLCVEGPVGPVNYDVVAQTNLKQITGLSLDVFPHDSLPKRGPGRGGDGNLTVNEIAVEELQNPQDTQPRPIAVTAVADFEQPGTSAGNTLDKKQKTIWGIYPQVGAPHRLVLHAASPVGASETTLIRFRIQQIVPIGRFMVSATTHAAPASLTAAPGPRQPLYTQDWVTLPITAFKSVAGATMQPQADGSALIQGDVKGRDSYEFHLRADLPIITAIKLEILHDASLPKGGPGRVTSGWFAISEINLSAAPLDHPTQLKPVTLSEPTADFATSPNVIERAFDGKPETFWGLQSHPGEDRTASFKLSPALGIPAGSALTLKIDQQLSVGRVRILATGMTDPARLRIEPIKVEAKAAHDARFEETEQCFLFGGLPHTDDKKREWKLAPPYVPGATGFEGPVITQHVPGGKDPIYSHCFQKIAAFHAVVPNGKYQVTLLFSEANPGVATGFRQFDVAIEGEKVNTAPLDIIKATGAVGKPLEPAPTVTTNVADGVLDVVFTGKESVISGIIIKRLRR